MPSVAYSTGVKFFNFEVVIEKEPEDEGYLAYSPGLKGCFSNGKTIEAARQNIREALVQHVQSCLANNIAISAGDYKTTDY
jgi:predicted RNase H-like HicB family nuclease